MGALSAAVFVGLIFYLLAALGSVEHTERAISNANQIAKLGANMEASLYGYLVIGEEALLQPFEIGKPRIAAETATLAELVSDNPVQVGRLRRIDALQGQWNDFAQNIVDLRRKDLDYQAPVRSASGKSLTDEIRREFASFISTGQQQLAEHTISQHALESLGRSVLEFVARFLDVAVAVLYVRESDGQLRRVAAYGFS